MSHTVDTDDVIEVIANGLQVRKTFTTDEFPVPAIRFEIESENDEPVSFRLSEEIPETFPMDGVGFHPEYHSENWTAFQDNHVEFTGTLEPGEELVTVYGIRIDDESKVEEFLTEPDLVHVDSEGASTTSEADTVDDSTISNIVSEDRNQVVKDMLTGVSEGVPGLGDEGKKPTEETSDEDVDPIQPDAGEQDEKPDEEDDTTGDAIELDLDLEDVDTVEEGSDEQGEEGSDEQDDTPDIDLGFTEDEIPDPVDEPDTADIGVDFDDETVDDTPDGEISDDELDDEVSDDEIVAEAGDDESDDDIPDDEADDTAEEAEGSKIELDLEAAATKTDESIGRNETVDSHVSDDDEEDTDDVDSTEPTVTAAVTDEPVGERLVREIREGTLSDEDLESLRTALGVDPSGSERAKLSHLQSRVEEVAAYTAALEEFLDEHDGGAALIEEFKYELSTFEDELETLENRVTETRDDLEDVNSRTSTVESALDGLDERFDPIESELDTFVDDLEEVRSDVESVDDGLSSVETELEELEETVAAVEADVVDITEWREQLGSMFSG